MKMIHFFLYIMMYQLTVWLLVILAALRGRRECSGSAISLASLIGQSKSVEKSTSITDLDPGSSIGIINGHKTAKNYLVSVNPTTVAYQSMAVTCFDLS